MTTGARIWKGAYLLVAAAFLVAVSRYYHPGLGFTAFIDFPASTHGDEIPAVRAAPHAHDPVGGGYDGQFYAQFAVEPLLRNPDIDRAMDKAPYRAHRILFSWTAYALGLGRTAWCLQAYAFQNVVIWLVMAWFLCRWFPPVGPRQFALWAGCLLSHGMLVSVQLALPDALATLLIAAGIAAADSGRPLLAAGIVGIAGLARETSLFAAAAFGRLLGRTPRSWIVAAACVLIAALPLILWLDYLRSIYRSLVFVGGDHVTVPLSGFLWLVRALGRIWSDPNRSLQFTLTCAALIGVASQCIYVAVAIARGNRTSWALACSTFVLLALTLHQVVWEGWPGAFTRVLLPLTIGTNVLLMQERRPLWPVIVLTNLGVVAGVVVFVTGVR